MYLPLFSQCNHMYIYRLRGVNGKVAYHFLTYTVPEKFALHANPIIGFVTRKVNGIKAIKTSPEKAMPISPTANSRLSMKSKQTLSRPSVINKKRLSQAAEIKPK